MGLPASPKPPIKMESPSLMVATASATLFTAFFIRLLPYIR
ncbi:hypothetical protein JCM19232_4498 [Vibrio ishigakensis]|uniref:Uncharacterized protein n=1 Tax=Vibrio ishigakensis TaxID=1481914 RepID=A0A0B8P908_9VIBR|nr:hypothetical protein JCM19232_4498 [Vibrio ishigakensis]